jgi:hypothetical protein
MNANTLNRRGFANSEINFGNHYFGISVAPFRGNETEYRNEVRSATPVPPASSTAQYSTTPPAT